MVRLLSNVDRNRTGFVIDHTKRDDSTERMYYRSDGNEWNGQQTTEQFVIEQAHPHGFTAMIKSWGSLFTKQVHYFQKYP